MIHEKFSTPELSNSLEDYIEAVRNIELEKGCATVGEIAEALNVKKPSASLAMKQLKERGLVEYTQYSPIVLTREGLEDVVGEALSSHTNDILVHAVGTCAHDTAQTTSTELQVLIECINEG